MQSIYGGCGQNRYVDGVVKCKCKTSKWYQQIAIHLFSFAVVNVSVIYRESGGTGALLPFLQSITISLVKGESFNREGELSDREVMTKPTRSLKRKHVPFEICYDGYNHWPVQVEGSAQQCKAEMCTRKIRFYCSKFQSFFV